MVVTEGYFDNAVLVAHGGTIALRNPDMVEGAGLALTFGGDLSYGGPYMAKHMADLGAMVVAPAFDHESLIEKVCEVSFGEAVHCDVAPNALCAVSTVVVTNLCVSVLGEELNVSSHVVM